MTAFRVPADRLRAAVAPVLPEGATDDDAALAARFAAGAWTVLPEPGDAAAGGMRAALGDEGALALLVDGASPAAWLAALDDPELGALLPAALQRWTPRLSAERMLSAFAQAAAFGQRLVMPGDAHWPAQLDDLGPHAPAALWVRGDPAALARAGRSAALVGSRASSGYGELVAAQLAGGLVDRGLAVVSGGAYGIDGTAHRAALASGGTTIAVLAGGLDRLYPAGNEALLQRVVETACAVAEAPCGTPPTRWRFLARNRLIAALASATVVVEAGARSGSINTAGHAASIGRPLGAVPGPVTSGGSAGCHRLLRDYGAAPIERAEDVVELVDGPAADGGGQPALSATAEEERVLDALSGRASRGIDELAVRTGLAPRDVEASLALLELAGRVGARGSGWVRIAEARAA